MTYQDGTEVLEGDVVLVRHAEQDARGVVRKVILPGTIDASAWSVPKGGILIEGGGLGLFVTASIDQDEDITFVSRAPSSMP